MNNQETVTLSLNIVVSLFLLSLSISSYKVSRNIRLIKNLKSDETPDGGMHSASIRIQDNGFDYNIGEMFKMLAQAIYDLSLGSFVGFILSLIPLALQAYYIAN
jgi:hypothetical protein